MRTDGQTNDQLEREPRVARALDVEEREVLVSGALIQQPPGATAVRAVLCREVHNDRHAKVRMRFQTKYRDRDEDEEDGKCRDNLHKRIDTDASTK